MVEIENCAKFIAIFVTLAMPLAGLLFLRSQISSSGSETKTEPSRKRADVTKKCQGCQGVGPRMQRRR